MLTLVERQQEHRHGLESRMVDGQLAAAKRGQWMALSITMAAIAFAAFALYLGQKPYAIGGVIGAISVLVGNFWNQRRKVDGELVDKRARDLLREEGYELTRRKR